MIENDLHEFNNVEFTLYTMKHTIYVLTIYSARKFEINFLLYMYLPNIMLTNISLNTSPFTAQCRF